MALARLSFFIFVSGAMHAFLLLDVEDQVDRKAPLTVRTTVVPILRAPTPETEPQARPASPPRAKASTVAPPAQKAAKAKEEREEAKPLPKLTRVAKAVGVDRGRPPEPTPEKRPVPEPRPRPTAPGRLETPFASREAYLERVLSEAADRAPRAGLAVPDLVTDDGLSFTDIVSIVRFYGCKVVAYPLPGNDTPTFYLELAGPDLRSINRREGPAPLEGFSNRARDLTGHPDFWSLLTRVAAQHHLDPYHARIVAVVPERVDRYFLYKQQRAAARAGLDLGAVRSTRARFRPTNVGWLLDVYAVTPIHGPTIRVASRVEEEWE